MKKRKIYKIKGYTHFDDRKCEYWKYISRIKEPKWIERHAFYPFIHYQEEKKKFNGKEIIKKSPRDIRYSSHIDRYIYEYYNEKLSEKYNEYAKTKGINHAAIAYRTNLHKSNIHFSRDVFKYLDNQKEAFVIVSDFSKFFDTLDHKYLKERLKELLELDTLPKDYYKVLKSITKYAYVEYKDILNKLNLTHRELVKLKKERLFDMEEFRKFKKNHIHINNKNYGIVQGSAISSVMSNIYMIKFDKSVNDLITSNNGIYKRYSDDIIVIIPNIAKGMELYEQILKIKDEVPNLKISEDKTKCFIKRENAINEIDIEKKKQIKEKTIINYLGFSYDGNTVKIREKTVSKYYRKMYASIKTINRMAIEKNKNIGRRKLYRRYSRLGKNTKESKKGNFLTYVDRAQKEYGKLGKFNNQVKNSWKYMSKRLIKVKK